MSSGAWQRKRLHKRGETENRSRVIIQSRKAFGATHEKAYSGLSYMPRTSSHPAQVRNNVIHEYHFPAVQPPPKKSSASVSGKTKNAPRECRGRLDVRTIGFPCSTPFRSKYFIPFVISHIKRASGNLSENVFSVAWTRAGDRRKVKEGARSMRRPGARVIGSGTTSEGCRSTHPLLGDGWESVQMSVIRRIGRGAIRSGSWVCGLFV